MVELLAPAGSFETLCAAVNAGADAVYIGGSMFGARAYAENPDEDMLIRGIEYCHLRGKKLYLTVNTLLKEKELETMLYPYLLPYYQNGLDAVIVQDMGVVRFIQEYFPGLDIHASTQMTVTGAGAASFLQNLGLTRVVPARELSLKEIKEIAATGIEVETFIHGAMCYAYSGQCLFSSMIGGRSGNRGRCAQPCRMNYTCTNAQKHTSGYLLSMKDMCTIDLLPDILDAGVMSLKIEGRMKRAEYAAGVVSVYRKYLDLYLKAGRKGYRVSQEDRQILMDLYNRGGFSDGYYKRHNGSVMMSMDRPNHFGTEAARITECRKGSANAVALEGLHPGDVLELPDGKEITLGKEWKSGASFPLPYSTAKLKKGDVLRRTKNDFLMQTLQERYLKESVPVKIKGDLKIFSNGSAILKLFCKDVTAELCDTIAEPAEKNSATEETVRKQMNKTGGTSFQFERLDISVAEGLFIPVKRLNDFRRKALATLEEQILSQFYRSVPMIPDGTQENKAEKSSKDCSCTERLTVSVLLPEQLNALQQLPEHVLQVLDIVYFDFSLFGSGMESDSAFSRTYAVLKELQEKKVRCFLHFPPIFRTKEKKIFCADGMKRIWGSFDGFLIHTIDEFTFVKSAENEAKTEVCIAADDSLYMYNRRSQQFWMERGVSQITLPGELNYRELQFLCGDQRELVVYGYQPLMHSAQCVTANTTGCTGKPKFIWLKDRKNMSFPVLNRCTSCCNTIYNAVPLELEGCMEEISRLSPSAIRLNFTHESAAEMTEKLIYYYTRFWEKGGSAELMGNGTKGHFKRGVE